VSATERITVGLTGVVDASGGGAIGPRDNRRIGGSGGGSGGGILLEAPVVEITGIVGANGGAGSRGDANRRGRVNGDPGQPGIAPVLGPPTAEGYGGGGAGSDAEGVGGDGVHATVGGGGGGGGGRIRINTAAGDETFSGVLPTFESGLATVGQLDLLDG
jgi:hypothetical protein